MAPPLPRTKIVATLGPACAKVDMLTRMVEAGVSVFRINLAHGTTSDHGRYVRLVRRVARRVKRPVAVMADLAGPKIRIGDLAQGKLDLVPGRTLVLTIDKARVTPTRIFVTEPSLARDARKGDPIYLSDGTLQLRVDRVADADIHCTVIHGGSLLPHKGVNVPSTALRVAGLTAKDRRDLVWIHRAGVDVVALSFVRRASDVERARRLMRGKRPLIAKIEKREAVDDLDNIARVADGLMVARGDLAVETSLEEVPLLQKRIVRVANAQAKPVITATQMLLSMVDQPRPTRAEAADVANAILDGSDAVMLSEETARGRFPFEAVETMARIARAAEPVLAEEDKARTAKPSDFTPGAVSEAAVAVARQVGAKAIVTPTFGGATPRFVARLRPAVPVLALSENPAAVQSLCLTWGVRSIHHRRLGDFDQMMASAEAELVRLGLVKRGDTFVVTAGYPKRQASNLMTVQTVGERRS